MTPDEHAGIMRRFRQAGIDRLRQDMDGHDYPCARQVVCDNPLDTALARVVGLSQTFRGKVHIAVGQDDQYAVVGTRDEADKALFERKISALKAAL